MSNDLGVIGIEVQVKGQDSVRNLTNDFNKLESTVVKQIKATERLERSYAILDKAFNTGKISLETYGKGVQEVDRAIEAVWKQTQKMDQAFQNANRSAQTFENTSRKGMRRIEVIAQQAGYQIGDLAVQIQSGTNAAVALGQQGSQLLGFFGPAGAIAGAALAIGTGLIAPFLKGEEAAGLLTDRIKDLKAEIADLEGVQLLPEEQVQLLSQQEDITLEILRLQEQLTKQREVSVSFEEKGLTNNQAYLTSLGLVSSTEQEIAALEKERAANSEQLLEYQGLLVEKRRVLADQEEKTLQQEIELGQAKISYGEQSLEVKALENQQILENYEAELKRLGIHDSIIQKLLEMKSEVIANAAELESASASAQNLERALQAAASAMSQLTGFSAGLDVKLAQATAKVDALQKGLNAASAATVAGLREEAKQRRDAAAQVAVGADQLRAINAEYVSSIDKIAKLEKANATFDKLSESQKKAAGSSKKLKEELTAAEKAAKQFASQMDGYVVNAVDGVADAFADFVMRGFKGFKGFVKDILGSFKNMLAQMIALAARNQILIGLGFAGAGAGGAGAALAGGFGASAAGAGAAGGIGAAFGTAASGFGSGFMTSVYGGLGGTMGAVSGGLSVGGLSGISTAIGAIAAPLLAVAGIFSFFKKKTKELDAGLRITVTNMDALVKSFQTIQTTRFFGLSKKTTTTESEVSAEISDPIVEAVQKMQTQIVKAAELFGISSDAFENFVYDFEVSLKGLTEEQKIQKINEEIVKMGDAFTALSGQFTSMNELLAAAQQRYDLTTRLLELQGNAEELLRRNRELELAATHELNRGLLTLVHAMEDVQMAAQRVDQAASNLRSAMDRQLSAAQSGLATARSQLEKAVGARVARIQSGFSRIFSSIESQIDSAKAKAERSRRIFELLDNALSGRSATSEAGAFASRRAAMTYVSSGGMDVDKLTSALGILNEPSEKFFGTFQDYARDFALTTNAIEKSRAVAEASMSADERAVQLLERQLEQARVNEARQIAAAEKLLIINEEVLTVEEAMAQYMEAQATYEQVQAQHEELIAQFPMLSETFLSVADAILALNSAIAAQTAAQTAVANAIASAANVPTGKVRGFAYGGMHSGGPRIVGESGPELEVTGPSRIYSNRDTANMFRDPELAGAVAGLRREVSGMRSEQLQIQVEISKNVKRVYDIERKWDTDGLPPERV
jgi:hypothetical protein